MGPKTAIGAIALMLLGVGIPAFFHVDWAGGGITSFIGLVLLFVSCRDWALGRNPVHLNFTNSDSTSPLIRSEWNSPAETLKPGGCPRVIMQFLAATQGSTFELTAMNSDAFEVEVQPLVCRDAVISWSLPRTVLLSGETMPATIHEVGKSGNSYNNGAPLLLELGLERLTSVEAPIVERSILITYRDVERQQWQTECPIRYDKRTEKVRFLTPEFSPPKDISSTDQRTLATLQQLLPNEGGIMKLRNQSFWGRFAWDSDAVLVWFLQQDTGPDHGFLDERLEELRLQLHEAIKLLLDRVHRYSDLPSKISDVASEKFRFFWKGENEDIATYDGRRNEVLEAAKKVCEIYDNLVLTARRKLEAS